MQFLKDIRDYHLKDFQTEAMDEILKFMDFLEKRYAPPTDAVPGPNPDPVGVEATFSPIVGDSEPTPVESIEEAPVEESSVIATVAPEAFTCQPASK